MELLDAFPDKSMDDFVVDTAHNSPLVLPDQQSLLHAPGQRNSMDRKRNRSRGLSLMIDAERIWNPDDNLLAGEGAIPHDLTLDFFAPVVENPTPFAADAPPRCSEVQASLAMDAAGMASGNLSLPADELLLPAGDHPRSWAPPPPPPPQLDRPRMRSSPFPSSRDRTAYQAPEPAVPPQRFPDVEPLPAWPPHAPRTPFNPCELPSPRKSRRTLPAGPDASPDLTASLDSTPGLPTSPGGRERGPAVAPNYTCDGAARRCTAPGNVEPTVVYDAFWSDAQAYARGGASLTPPRSPPLGAGYAYGSLPAHARSAVAPGDFSRWHADQRAVTAAAAADLWRASLAPAAQTAAFGELAGDDGPRGVETALLQECETLMLAARHAGVPPPGVAPRNSSSQYRGVTKHRRTGRFEGHVWHQGKQLYLGGFAEEAFAARAHDIMAIKCRGHARAPLNFPVEDYRSVVDLIEATTDDEITNVLRTLSRQVGC